MITGRQIRAARCLLGWDAEQLALAADITRATVSRIETDTVQPQSQSLTRILQAFDVQGIEFIDGGVRLRQQPVEILEGKTALDRFCMANYEELAANGGLMVQSGIIEEYFDKYMVTHKDEYMEKMTALCKERKDVKVQILIEEGDQNLYAGYATYRWQPKRYFSPSPFIVVGNKLALISYTHDPAPLIVVIRSASLAEAYKQSFALAWKNARIPPKPKK